MEPLSDQLGDTGSSLGWIFRCVITTKAGLWLQRSVDAAKDATEIGEDAIVVLLTEVQERIADRPSKLYDPVPHYLFEHFMISAEMLYAFISGLYNMSRDTNSDQWRDDTISVDNDIRKEIAEVLQKATAMLTTLNTQLPTCMQVIRTAIASKYVLSEYKHQSVHFKRMGYIDSNVSDVIKKRLVKRKNIQKCTK